MTSPLVSVGMVTYNHERYVAEAVRSVLDQTFADLELVVVNDGSTDGTAARLAEFTDPRLVVINQANGGPSVATNRAIEASRGKYVALFSGDDVCHPDRIRRQVEEYERRPGRILFTGCDFIGDDGRPLTDGHFAATSFEAENRSRAAVLARLFHAGNYFNGVSVFTELSIIRSAPYDPGLLQLQDYDVWVRLVKNHGLWIMPDRLVRYRIRGDAGNLSSPRRDQLLRLANEYYLILRRYFDGVSADLFREAFADELVVPDFADGPEYACEQALLYYRSQRPLIRLIGVERLHALLAEPATAKVLTEKYGFTNRSFFDLLGSVDVTQPFDGGFSTIYLDNGAGWDPDSRVWQHVSPTIEKFDLRFVLPDGVRPRALRWDPVELQTCRVRIDAIEMRDVEGNALAVGPMTVTSNGERLPDGTVSFATSDPMFWWSVAGEVREVSIRGRWETDDALKTVLSQSQHVHALQHALGEARREIRALRESASWRYTAPLRAMNRFRHRLTG